MNTEEYLGTALKRWMDYASKTDMAGEMLKKKVDRAGGDNELYKTILLRNAAFMKAKADSAADYIKKCAPILSMDGLSGYMGKDQKLADIQYRCEMNQKDSLLKVLSINDNTPIEEFEKNYMFYFLLYSLLYDLIEYLSVDSNGTTFLREVNKDTLLATVRDSLQFDKDNYLLSYDESKKIIAEKKRKEEEAKRIEEERRRIAEAKRVAEAKKIEEERWRIAEAKRKEEFRANKVCQYCGGKFKGLFRKSCSQCGKEKDY